MYKLLASSFNQEELEVWLDFPESQDELELYEDLDKLLELDSSDSSMVLDIKGFKYFNMDNHDPEPHLWLEVIKFSRKYGRAAEVFAEIAGPRSLYSHFEECFIGEFNSIKNFGSFLRRRGIFKFHNLIDNTPIPIKVNLIADLEKLTIIVRDDILFVFWGLDPSINELYLL